MHYVRLTPSLCALTLVGTFFVSPASADKYSRCNALGVDFEDGGSYFINTGSKDSVTIASQFSGCNSDTANIILAGPLGHNSAEYDCTTVPTSPSGITQISTCPISKDKLASGQYIIMLFGNNGDSIFPFSSQRNISLTCGQQTTTTITPTIVWNVTTTPVETITDTSTVSITSTFNATTTFTQPSVTADKTCTVTPKATTTTIVKTISRVKPVFTWDRTIVTETKTASCSLLPKPTKVDPPCSYKPTKSHAAWSKWTALPKVHVARNADHQLDLDDEYVQGVIERARERRVRRRDVTVAGGGADKATVTVIASIPLNSTVTVTAAPITEIDIQLATVTVSTTLAPSTVYSGIYLPTVTASQATKTRFSRTVTDVTITRSTRFTWTKTVMTTPSASASACKKAGGWFPQAPRRGW